MKLVTLFVIGCVGATPMPCPTPVPPPASTCSAATLPPLVKGWLQTRPLPAPNDDMVTLLVNWAGTNCLP